MLKLILVTLVLFNAAAHADVSGNLSLADQNISIDTGILGYTVKLCDSNADCQSYTCFLDYDGTSETGSGFAGWCNATYVTNCYHNDMIYANGTTICVSATAHRTCHSPLWGNQTDCSSGYVCSGRECVSNTTGNGNGGSRTGGSLDQNPKIEITKFPEDFSIKQNESVIKTVKANNTGDVTLKNTSLSITGISSDWYSITPDKDNFTIINEAVEFTINLTVPSNAEVKEYSVVLTVSTSNTSVSNSKTITITILPSQETVQSYILPNQENLFSRATELENRLEEVKAQISQESYNSIKNLLDNAKRKIIDAQNKIDDEDYVSAVDLQKDAETLLDNIELEIEEALEKDRVFPVVPVVAGVIIAAIIGAAIYIKLPAKEGGFLPERGWSPASEKIRKNKLKKLLEKLRTRKKSGFSYEFRK